MSGTHLNSTSSLNNPRGAEEMTIPASTFQVSSPTRQSNKLPITSSAISPLDEIVYSTPFSADPLYNKTLGSYISVIIDDREGQAGSKILDLLHRYDVPAEIRRLTSGDYAFAVLPQTMGIILPPIIERKAKKDLQSSLDDGRLYKQINQAPNITLDLGTEKIIMGVYSEEERFIKSIYDLWKMEDNIAVLCEGTQFEDYKITALLCTLEIPVCFTGDIYETALLIAGLHHKLTIKLSQTLTHVSNINSATIRNKLSSIGVPMIIDVEGGGGAIDQNDLEKKKETIRDTYTKIIKMICGEKGDNVLSEFPTYKSFCDNSNSPIISNLPLKAKMLLIPENP